MTNALLTEIDLVREAQSGDVHALGLLLAMHQADMHAVAFSILGYRPDAEDAVQEAVLIVLRRIGDLRDPAALKPWLRAIVRTACLTQMRTTKPTPVEEVEPCSFLASIAIPRDCWTATSCGTGWRTPWTNCRPRLRLVTMLRYFTDITSYEDIAQVCGIPVGTVRSRLSQARAKLSEALLATAGLPHDDMTAPTRRCRRQAEETMRAARDGSFGQGDGRPLPARGGGRHDEGPAQEGHRLPAGGDEPRPRDRRAAARRRRRDRP